MKDRLTKAQRSYAMSRVRSTNTSLEVKLKTPMRKLGFRYQPQGLYGRPDFANDNRKVAVFIDGCFWHGCKKCKKLPTANADYWKSKIGRNMKRDRLVSKTLRAQGWTVMRFWEHQIKSNPDVVAQRVRNRQSEQ